jgi:hypothetical protein
MIERGHTAVSGDLDVGSGEDRDADLRQVGDAAVPGRGSYHAVP